MLLEIDDTKTTRDLQDRFSLCFPELKIEFCSKGHHWEELCEESQLLKTARNIGSIRKNHAPGVLEIKTAHKVGDIEKRFYDQFGLNVQIFFQGRKKWVQTGKSDNLRIADLISQARFKSNHILL